MNIERIEELCREIQQVEDEKGLEFLTEGWSEKWVSLKEEQERLEFTLVLEVRFPMMK